MVLAAAAAAAAAALFRALTLDINLTNNVVGNSLIEKQNGGI